MSEHLTTPEEGDTMEPEASCMPISKLPEELWELREASGLTQALLADRLGVTQKTLEAMENGRAPIPERVELAWRSICRRYRAYCAIRYNAVPEGCVDLGDTSDVSGLLQEHFRRRRERKSKRGVV